jgi:hypothetical protein
MTWYIYSLFKNMFCNLLQPEKTSGFIDGREFSNQMSIYQLLKGSTPWSELPRE